MPFCWWNLQMGKKTVLRLLGKKKCIATYDLIASHSVHVYPESNNDDMGLCSRQEITDAGIFPVMIIWNLALKRLHWQCAGMNILCGVGILSTPYAVKEGGWVGLSILLIFALLSFYTGILLRYCLDSAPGLETYPDIGQAAFGTTGRFAISVSLLILSFLSPLVINFLSNKEYYTASMENN